MQGRLTRYTFLLGITCLLGACGFQLRGVGSDTSAALPESWKTMVLATGNPNSELSRDVQSVFAANGIEWVGKEDAQFKLVLGPERFNRTNLSLNSEARVSEFELSMQTRFTLLSTDGTEVMPETNASVIRQMENDSYNVVGKAEEVRILRGEMRTELARQILRRIGFFASSR